MRNTKRILEIMIRQQIMVISARLFQNVNWCSLLEYE